MIDLESSGICNRGLRLYKRRDIVVCGQTDERQERQAIARCDTERLGRCRGTGAHGLRSSPDHFLHQSSWPPNR